MLGITGLENRGAAALAGIGFVGSRERDRGLGDFVPSPGIHMEPKKGECHPPGSAVSPPWGRGVRCTGAVDPLSQCDLHRTFSLTRSAGAHCSASAGGRKFCCNTNENFLSITQSLAWREGVPVTGDSQSCVLMSGVSICQENSNSPQAHATYLFSVFILTLFYKDAEAQRVSRTCPKPHRL